jgi:hypothetical protein
MHTRTGGETHDELHDPSDKRGRDACAEREHADEQPTVPTPAGRLRRAGTRAVGRTRALACTRDDEGRPGTKDEDKKGTAGACDYANRLSGRGVLFG